MKHILPHIRPCLTAVTVSLVLALPLAAQQNASTTGALDNSPAPNALATAGIVLQVNNDGVTSTDVLQPIRDQLLPLAQELGQPAFFQRALPIVANSATEQIRNLLLYQYAYGKLKENENFELAIENQLDKRKREFLARYDGSIARAQNELAQKGTTLEDELERLKRSFVVAAYQEIHFMPSFEITRDQMLQYYNENRDKKYSEKPSLQFQLIDIQIERFLPNGVSSPTPQQREQATEAARQAANQAMEELRNGGDFAQVVHKYSHGYRRSYDGLWRPIDPAALNENYRPIPKALESLEPNEFTNVIPAKDRFFIAKLVHQTPAVVHPFTDVQDDIAQTLRSEQWKEFTFRLSNDLLDHAVLGDIDVFVRDVAALAWRQMSSQPESTAAAATNP